MSDKNTDHDAPATTETASHVSNTSETIKTAEEGIFSSSVSPLNSAEDGGTAEPSRLLEELRQLKKKLSKLDERTKRDARAIEQINYTANKIARAKEMHSISSGETNTLRRTTVDGLFNEFITTPGDMRLIRRYMDYDTRRLQYQHMHENYLHSRFEDELENYATRLRLESREAPTPKKPESREAPTPKKSESDLLTLPTKVEINQLRWLAWKSRQNMAGNSPYVIDVLLGEPNLSPHGLLVQKLTDNSSVALESDEGIQIPEMVTGEEPLPERIRLNSRSLILLVCRLSETVLRPVRPVVLVRPYKLLTFYHRQIQRDYDETRAEIDDRAREGKKINTAANAPTDRTLKNQGSGQPAAEATISQNEGQESNRLETLEAKKTYYQCLLDFIDSYISSKQKYLEQDCKRVSFFELWHLFKPGTEVIEAGDKHRQCYRIVKVTSPKHKVSTKYSWFFRSKGRTETTVSIYCVYVDFDGSLVSKKFDITRYEGQKDVRSLPVYPLRFEYDGGRLRELLIERGNKFLRVLRVGHMHYSGLTVDSRDEIDSHVVIDFTEAFANRDGHENESWKPRVQIQARAEGERLNKDSDSDSDSDSEPENCDGECCYGETVIDDSNIDAKQNETYLSDLLENTEEGRPAPLEVLARPLQKGNEIYVSDDDLLIMSYRVFGFVLRSRSWAKLDVADLMELDEYRKRREIENPTGESKSNNAFDNLVFPKDGLDRKKIVRSLVAQHFRDKESTSSYEEQSDIVRGKELGKGLIILLHGAPGVGKTSTAEGIAELFNKPLFQITCGDLGTTAKEVEAALETNFSLANKWGSILLLDEADVFLARRTPHDFQRNGLVAVFLRVLEYYAGILFLTTNRIGDFDEAFSSRIHISLHYPVLDYDSSVDIFDLNWRLIKARFKNKGRDIEIDESKITASLTDYWHKHPNARWNGRQIRNACQTALALAEFEAQTSGEDGVVINPTAKVHLGVSHMKTVSDAYLEFIKYLQDVRDADQERYAYLIGIRGHESASMPPENPLAYGPSTPQHRGQVSRLAEHRAKSAARYGRPDQGIYPPSNLYVNERPGYPYGDPMSGGAASPYQPFSQQPSGTAAGPYQPALGPQAQRGWNPGPVGGYYAAQETHFQQGPLPGTEAFSSSQPYGPNTQ
ncbi:hypothetical protein RRF57_011432 [Xylaria bambusicola]|uniref:AAA+ ATPase domain-containing protein n=1 Tax=Xylaria bambusicola TaxID=326684 RepID=A0AAN7Z3P4_9PEZI